MASKTGVSVEEVKSRYFSFILYYDNTQHMELFDFLKNHIDHYNVVYIHHDGEEVVTGMEDVDDDGAVVSDDEVHQGKDHIHVLVHTERQGRVNGVSRMFGGCLSYIKPIFSPIAYIRYMCHDTYNSRGKKRYQISDLRGDEKMIKRAYSSQNAYYIQFNEIVQELRNGATLTDIVEDCVQEMAQAELSDGRLHRWHCLMEYQYLIIAMAKEMQHYNIQRIIDSVERKSQDKMFKSKVSSFITADEYLSKLGIKVK